MTMSSERYCESCGAHNEDEAETCFACKASLTTIDEKIHDVSASAHILHNRYRLLKQVGSGGFSAVYKAEDLGTGNFVAIKAISLRVLSTQEKIEATDAFNREVSLLSKLHHRNLPSLHDTFSDTECWYVVMDFIEGITLEKRLEQVGPARLPVEEAIDIALVLCNVLEYLHCQQPAIIFRDLKPGNIMLTPDGRLFLIDFGIARLFKPGQARDTIPFGSPGYAAPEQYGKTQTTVRSDIYSLGAILHQLLTGDDPSQTPFTFTPPGQQRPELASLDSIVVQMVQMDAQKRPETIKIVKKELQQFAAQQGYGKGLAVQSGIQPASGPITLSGTPPTYHPFYQPPFANSTGTMASTQMMMGQRQLASPPPVSYPAAHQSNWYALTSLVASLIGVFLPVVLCSSGSYSLWSPWGQSNWFLVFVLTLGPSLVSIICGHIGRFKAKQNLAMYTSEDTATAGLILGYVFGGIYIVFMLCLLHSALTFHLFR